MSDITLLSPKDRLAASRQAIVRQMNHETAEPGHASNADGGESAAIDASSSTWQLATQVVSGWWRNHPAHLAVEIATPLLKTYAEEKPLKLLGAAAAAGAAVVLFRPWRLMSLSGVLMTALKTSGVSGIVNSLLSGIGRH